MRHPLSNFGTFNYFQLSILLGVDKGLQELKKSDKNQLRLLLHFCSLIPRKWPHKTPFDHIVGQGTVVILGLLKDKVLLLVHPKSGMGLPLHPWFQQSFSIVRPPRCTCFFAPIPCLIVCDVAYYVRMPKKFYDLALEEI